MNEYIDIFSKEVPNSKQIGYPEVQKYAIEIWVKVPFYLILY